MPKQQLPERVQKLLDEYGTKDNAWHVWNLVFGLGSIFASAFGSAFNFVENSNHILWSSITLVGTACAGMSTMLFPGTRSERYSKAEQHLSAAALKFEEGLITIEELSKAYDEAGVIAMGGPTQP